MDFTPHLQERLKSLAKRQIINHVGGMYSAASFFDIKQEHAVLEVIESFFKPYKRDGELISVEIGKGEVEDSGREYFKITGGEIFEFYYYKELVSIFLRLYRIKGNDKEWLALYIDENPKTPWWKDEER